ncbi:MAG: hypothetical protein JNL82_26370 [Myxococcales bacterium]|nr:hypothetical protein [Myxococcales bacterium]
MSDDPIQLAINILALVLAVIAGLWFGKMLGESSNERAKDGAPRRSFGKTLQAAATTSMVRLWQWRRARAKEAERKKRESGQS